MLLWKWHGKSRYLLKCRKEFLIINLKIKIKEKCQSEGLTKIFNHFYQQVKEGSRAENSGLKLGDSIVSINSQDTSGMTLQEANNVLEQAAQQDVKLGVIKWVALKRILN